MKDKGAPPRRKGAPSGRKDAFRRGYAGMTRYDVEVADASLDSLTPDERAWLEKDELRWRRARAIAAEHPGMDPGGVYRVIRNLEITPSERLRRALLHGRHLRPNAR